MADTDTAMLEQMGSALVNLQVKFKRSSLDDRALMRPSLTEAMQDYAAYQTKLLKEGVVTTEADLTDMRDIRASIDAAGDKQSLLLAIGRVIGFIGMRI